MNKVESKLLTSNQFSKLMIFSTIAIGILSLPNAVVKMAKQDGWISVLLGGVYLFYIIGCALYIARNYPNENILALNRKFFGKILGTLFNILQLFIYIFSVVSEVAGISNLLRVYIIDFLSSFRVMFVYITIAALCSYKGLKAVGRISEIVFYNIILSLAIGVIALTKGSVLNIMPAFGSGFVNIIKGINGGVYAYSGIEIVLLLYPYINDKNKLKTACIQSSVLICISYTWVTFITIFYLSHTIIPKAIWSSLYIIESLRLPIINNFRFVFMFLWIFVSITAVAVHYYACELVIRDLFKKLKRNIFYFLSVPIMLYTSMLLNEEIQRREIIYPMMGIILIFNVLYILLMVFMVHFKKEKAYE